MKQKLHSSEEIGRLTCFGPLRVRLFGSLKTLPG